MPRFHIHHSTRYTYESTVRDSANQLILYPISDEWQRVMNYSLTVSRNPVVEVHRDYFGNSVQTFTLTDPHSELEIISSFTVETTARTLPGADVQLLQVSADTLQNDLSLLDFMKADSLSALPELQDLVRNAVASGLSPYHLAEHFSGYIFREFRYIKGVTTIETTISEIWKLKAGVCQDFAHLLLAILRSAGIPARYVSGYICPVQNEMRGIGATHAWVEAWLPGYGWLGIDPTNNCLVNEHHVRLAIGRNFNDCSPVKGTYRGTSNHKLEVVVSVSYEDQPATPASARPQKVLTPLFKKQQIENQQQ